MGETIYEKKTLFNTSLNSNVYKLGFLKWKSKTLFKKKTKKIGLYANIVNKVLYAVKKKDGKKEKKNSAKMADIDKILNVKPKIIFKPNIPEQYWGYLIVFDENENNQ